MKTLTGPTHSSSASTRPKNRLLLWTKRILLGFLLVLFTLSAAGMLYQAAGVRADRQNFPPPGRLYDVGGYRLHLYRTGPQDSGNPTVILDTLSGGTSANWGWIQPEIARVTRVCSYDRAGRGWSEASPHPLTLQQTVIDLHRLLQTAGVRGPYVLVGHSIGGIYLRRYIAEHPAEVASLVMLDTSHPDQYQRNPQLLADNEAYLRISAEYFNSQRAETRAGPAIFAEAHTLGSLGSLPLAVVSRGKNPPEGWAKLQAELVALSSNSIHTTVADATYVSLAFDPRHARASSGAILQVVEAARTGQPLASK